METMKFSGRPRFHKGIIIAIRSTIGVQKIMAEKYGTPYLKTSSTTQDFMESFFSIIRDMGGSNNKP